MKRLAATAFAWLAFAAVPAFAHHSLSFFDQIKVTKMHGVIFKMEWAAPHSWLYMKADDGTLWPLEAGCPSQLTGAGYKRSDLSVGNKLTVLLHPLRDGRLGGSLMALKLDHGRAIAVPDGLTLASN